MPRHGQAERCFALRFVCDQYYLPDAPPLHLVALVALSQGGARIEVGVLPYQPGLALEQLTGSRDSLMTFATCHGAAWLNLSAPLTLAPVQVSKPWGKEVWFTGIEARGQASVSAGGLQTPLPWLLALAPRRLANERPRDLILLKELHPHPQPVFGDLYFEVHRHKREAYVVTHLDADAWPEGVGGVRYGFNAEALARYDDDQAFKCAYLQAVQAYEATRREIDAYLDDQRQRAGLSGSEPLPVETVEAWLEQLPEDLGAAERRLRAAMERFIHVRPVRLGDVVTVPPLTPHGLLHGVRVVEFQTADYERQILSFGQKVLTQDRWDTAEALNGIPLQTPPAPCTPRWAPGPGMSIERLVQFPAFLVLRVVLGPGASFSWSEVRRAVGADHAEQRYALLMCLQGEFGWRAHEAQPIEAGQAQLLTASCEEGHFHNRGGTDAIMLVAIPDGAS